MNELTSHVIEGSWVKFFDPSEVGHAMNFLYNLLIRLVRDEADQLKITSDEFAWSKQGKVVGRFPIKIEPTPSFYEILLRILSQDIVVKKYLSLLSEEEKTFYIGSQANT